MASYGATKPEATARRCGSQLLPVLPPSCPNHECQRKIREAAACSALFDLETSALRRGATVVKKDLGLVKMEA